ncbi:MAG: hypothetical protein WCD31_06470 [Gillisia sp.]
MKIGFFYSCIVFLLLFTSCHKSEGKITGWYKKHYSFYDRQGKALQDGILIDSIFYKIRNNRIVEFSGETSINRFPTSVRGKFEYKNGRIIKIRQFKGKRLITTIRYFYNTQGKLSKFQSLFWDPFYHRYKHYVLEFDYKNPDTIFSVGKSSADGKIYKKVMASKFVFDGHNNRTYYQTKSRGENEICTASYDSLGNILSFKIQGKNAYFYSYSSGKNSEALIYNNSFGKVTNLLTTLSTNGFLPKNISPYLLKNISKEGKKDSFQYFIQTATNRNNRSLSTRYKEISNKRKGNEEVSEFIYE